MYIETALHTKNVIIIAKLKIHIEGKVRVRTAFIKYNIINTNNTNGNSYNQVMDLINFK